MQVRKAPRYTVCRDGRWYWQPTRKMREAGFHLDALGPDRVPAWKRAERLNAEWDEIRRGAKDKATTAKSNTVPWLIDRFQKDPEWYLAKAPATRVEMDACFREIRTYRATPGTVPVFEAIHAGAIERRHVRKFYNDLRGTGSAHKARKIIKWFRRLMSYAIELGVRETNPAADLRIEGTPGRDQKWTVEEIDALKAACIAGGRRSLALAVQLAYDTTQRRQDILALQWPQFDGEGITFRQKKTGRELWVALSPESLAMLSATPRTSTYVIVSEETSRPYTVPYVFSRMVTRYRKRAGIDRDLTFHDFRRTGASEVAEAGGSESEIGGGYTGHAPGSPALKVYVKPGRAVAKSAAAKRLAHQRSLREKSEPGKKV